MRLDDLADPFRIEQVGETLRRVCGLHQVGVVGDHAERHAEAREGAVGILVLGRVILGDVLGQIGCEQAVALPYDQVRGVRGIDDVASMNVAAVFLPDALEDAFCARTLGAHRNPGILRLERLRDLLGDRQVDRRVVDDLAFFLCSLDQCVGHGLHRGRG